MAKRLSFTQIMQTKEAKLRGIYLSIACDFERIMDDVIMICERERAGDEPDYRHKYITKLEMGKKLGRCQKGLQSQFPHHYTDFEPYFTIIDELVKDRNIFAHGYSDYDDNNQDEQHIMFRHVHKGKQHNLRVDINPYITKLLTYRACIMELLGLVATIRLETNL